MDYRRGSSPTGRKVELQAAIRKTLKGGKKTFSELLKETDSSRSALASHLKDMNKKGEVKRETDPEDYRITHYSLTATGRNELNRQVDIETISSGKLEEFLFPPPEAIAEFAKKLIKFLEPSLQHYLLDPEGNYAGILKECIRTSFYWDKSLKDADKNYVKKLAELAATSMLAEFVTLRRKEAFKLKKISNLAILFRFDTAKIDEYLRRVESEMNKGPMLKLPDIRNYGKNENGKIKGVQKGFVEKEKQKEP